MQGWLPLFPLQVVLLPDAELPLHIFEDRYKEMIAEVLRDKIEFGVVLANERGIVNTGCTATIERVLREYPDGRLDILTVGRRRFEIERVNEERPFLRGEVDYFDDEDETLPEDEFRVRAIAGYNELRALTAESPLPAAQTSKIRNSASGWRVRFRTWDYGRRCLRRAARRNGCANWLNFCRRS